MPALEGALAGTVGGAVSSAILPAVLIGAAVVGVTVLGVEGYKYLTAGKAAVTPTIAEQILQMARKKKEEQETIKNTPEDYGTINPDGSKIDTEGGEEGKNSNDDKEEEPAPKDPKPEEPKPENNSSSSNNGSEVSGDTRLKIEQLIKQIPNQYKANGQCSGFARRLVQLLSENGIAYEIIRVDSEYGIYSDKARDLIGIGYHYGVKIGNIIYDNLTLKGMDFLLWLKDLGLTDLLNDEIKWRVVDEILSH